MPWISLTSLQLINVNLPPTAFFPAPPYGRWKITFNAVNITPQIESGQGSDTALIQQSASSASNSRTAELRITEHLTSSINLSDRCLRAIQAIRNLNRNTFGNVLLECCGLKYKLNLSNHHSLSFSVAPEPDLCFFGVQVELNTTTDPFQLSEISGGLVGQQTRMRYQISGGATVKMGLSPEGWIQLWRYTGPRILSVLRTIPNAARAIYSLVMGISATTLVIVGGTIVGTAMLTASMAYFVDSARRQGLSLSRCRAFAEGYVDALSSAEISADNMTRNQQSYRSLHGRTQPSRADGYDSALNNAILIANYTSTRRNLLTTIGLAGELEGQRRDGSLVSITLTGFRPFNHRSKNYIIGSFAEYLHYHRIRAQTIPIPI